MVLASWVVSWVPGSMNGRSGPSARFSEISIVAASMASILSIYKSSMAAVDEFVKVRKKKWGCARGIENPRGISYVVRNGMIL